MGLKTYQKGPGTLNYAIIRKQTSKDTILSFLKLSPQASYLGPFSILIKSAMMYSNNK